MGSLSIFSSESEIQNGCGFLGFLPFIHFDPTSNETRNAFDRLPFLNFKEDSKLRSSLPLAETICNFRSPSIFLSSVQETSISIVETIFSPSHDSFYYPFGFLLRKTGWALMMPRKRHKVHRNFARY